MVNLSGIQTGPVGTTARNLYRTTSGTETLKLVTTINDNTTSVYDDSVADGALGATAPSVTTARNCVIPLSSVSVGPSGTTSRKVYRRPTGSGVAFKLALTIGDNSTTTASDSNVSLGADAPTVNTFYQRVTHLTSIPTGDVLVTSRRVYRTAIGASQLKLVGTINDNSTTTYADSIVDASLGADVPTSNTTVAQRTAISAVSPGPTGTTDRNVYRSVVGGAQLKLLTTIAGNVTTTFSDSTADGSLGANAPIADSSGLTRANGVILAGSSTLLTSGISTPETSGWVLAGKQAIRYTGISGNTLTGVPTSGAGSILQTIAYGDALTFSPGVKGVTGLTNALQNGISTFQGQVGLALWVQVDDTTAQATQAALEAASFPGSDGIYEYTIEDASLTSYAQCTAVGDADLSLFAYPIQSIHYFTRDPNSHPGRVVTVNRFGVNGSFRLQSVTISQIGEYTNTYPLYEVRASTSKFSLQDLLRNVLLNQ